MEVALGGQESRSLNDTSSQKLSSQILNWFDKN